MPLLLPDQPINHPPYTVPDRVVITGIGTVTPQGCSTLSTALALRFRKSAWCEHETVLVADDPHGIVLRGATVNRLSEDVIPPELDGAERAAALFSPALTQCLSELSPNEIRRLDCRIDNFIDHERNDFPQIMGEAFPTLSLVPDQLLSDHADDCGHSAFFERIIKAAEELRAGKSERILVGCVDSLCATSWLMSVRDEGILKDAITPEGIIAGESAGAVLLELESTARKRNATVLAVLAAWGRGTETGSWHGTPPAIGRGLTQAFHQALSSLDDGGKSIATIIVDLNGERHRALDWAYAEGRIFTDGAEQERELRHPSFITGDCGSATAAVIMADAIGRFTFHPRFTGRVALATSDQSGARRVICIETGDVPDRCLLMQKIRTETQENKTPE